VRRNADLHPDDHAARVALRDHLRDLRHAHGLSQRQYADLLGVTQGAVGSFEGCPRANMMIASTQRRARVLNHRLTLTIAGLPGVPPTPETANAWALSEDPNPDIADTFYRIAIISHLRTIRLWSETTLQQLADRMGCRESAVSMAERGQDNPALSTYQRFARALGGRLDLSLQPVHEHVQS